MPSYILAVMRPNYCCMIIMDSSMQTVCTIYIVHKNSAHSLAYNVNLM